MESDKYTASENNHKWIMPVLLQNIIFKWAGVTILMLVIWLYLKWLAVISI